MNIWMRYFHLMAIFHNVLFASVALNRWYCTDITSRHIISDVNAHGLNKPISYQVQKADQISMTSFGAPRGGRIINMSKCFGTGPKSTRCHLASIWSRSGSCTSWLIYEGSSSVYARPHSTFRSHMGISGSSVTHCNVMVLQAFKRN